MALADLIARVGGAGARAAGDPADDGVDTAGDAMSGRSEAEDGDENINLTQSTRIPPIDGDNCCCRRCKDSRATMKLLMGGREGK